MKKVVTVLMAAIMTFGLATTAFAAGSVVADTTTVEYSVDANGESVAIVKKETFNTPEEQAAVDELKADPAKALAETKTDVNASAYTCVSVFDLVVDGDPEAAAWPIYLTFGVPEVEVGDTVVVLHYVNGAWQSEEVAVLEAGKIQVKFDSLSPVAIYVAKETAATDGEKAASESKTTTVASGSTSASKASTGASTGSTTASTSTTSTTGKTSPQTGAAPIVEMMVVIAAMAVAGMCVTAKRKDA